MASVSIKNLYLSFGEVKVLQESEREQMFGDALPAGLRLSDA